MNTHAGTLTQEQNPQDDLMRTAGGCPVCGRFDGFMYDGCTYWLVCTKHKIKLAYQYGWTPERYEWPECREQQAILDTYRYYEPPKFLPELSERNRDAVETTVKGIRKAAEQNDAEAQLNLGILHIFGLCVPKDDVEAEKWFRKAAEQNLAEAQRNLAYCYLDGVGVPKDDVEAAKWFRKAAEQNDAQAQYDLAWCYREGIGVPKDDVEAEKWFASSRILLRLNSIRVAATATTLNGADTVDNCPHS